MTGSSGDSVSHNIRLQVSVRKTHERESALKIQTERLASYEVFLPDLNAPYINHAEILAQEVARFKRYLEAEIRSTLGEVPSGEDEQIRS